MVNLQPFFSLPGVEGRMDGGVGEGGSALGGGEGSRDRSSMCALKERDLEHQMSVAASEHQLECPGAEAYRIPIYPTPPASSAL